MKTAAIYTRVSSLSQQEHSTSLRSQYDACKQYAAQHGFEVLAHDDEGVGDSMTQDRPALQRALARIKSKEADVLLCHDVDRLSRDVADQWDILRQVERTGGALHFVLLPPEDSNSWLILFAMKGVVGTIEKRAIKRRTSLGKHTAAKEGKVLGGWMEPYGYHYVKGQGRWEPVEEELHWVRKMFDWCVGEQCTLGEIARRLNEAGVPTKRNRGPWHFTTIRDMLTNSLYAGQWHWNKTDQRGHKGKKARPIEEWIAIPVEPVVSESMVEAACQVMKRNIEMSPRGCKREYTLRGLVFCYECGYRMRGMAKGTASAERTCYRCNSRYNLQRHLRIEDRCENKGQFYCDEIDELVWQAVVRVVSDPKRIAETLQAQVSQDEDGHDGGDISALEKQAQELVRRLENLYDYAESGILTALYSESVKPGLTRSWRPRKPHS